MPKSTKSKRGDRSTDITAYIKNGSLDDYLTETCLKSTIGEVVAKREKTASARAFFISDLIFSAVFEQDMAIINQIISRIDGTTPASEDSTQYANFTGMAIMDIMDITESERMRIMPDDLVIIALAKVIFVVATSHPKKGSPYRKEKQLACEIILNRVGGRKTAPVRPVITSKYKEPDWMRQLETGQNDSNLSESDLESEPKSESELSSG